MFIAHSGHWLVNVVYAGPVLVIVGWLGFTTLRERRRERRAASTVPPKDKS